MNARGRAEQLAEWLAHLPTDQWVEALLDFHREATEESRARFFLTYPWWLTRMGHGDLALQEDHVETLLELARTNPREDFVFYAGSCGVPTAEREPLWEGTRRRLGYDG